MHEKIKKSPLTYVLAQIKFSPILSMEETHIPDLQKVIRTDFSEYKEQTIESFNLNNKTYNKTKSWHFSDKNFTSAIVVTTDSITIHTSKYISFEDMANKLKKVLNKFNEIVKNELYLRIGLRYINFIHTNIEEALEPELLGYPLRNNDIFEDTYLARTETIQKTKNGTIKINAMHISSKDIIGDKNIYIPPELAPTADPLSFEHHKNKDPKKEYVTLDIDHFIEARGDFTAERIIENLNNLHEGSFVAFRNAIKKETWNKWK